MYGRNISVTTGPQYTKRTSYRKISWRLKTTRFRLRLFQSLWNMTGTCQASKRYMNYNIQSRGLETSRDLAVRRLAAYWIETRNCGLYDDLMIWRRFPHYLPLRGEYTGHQWIPNKIVPVVHNLRFSLVRVKTIFWTNCRVGSDLKRHVVMMLTRLQFNETPVNCTGYF